MVQCHRTMVHPCATMVYCKRTMVHPCVTMVQAWYKEVVPWYIMVYHGTLYLYHSISICNHMEQFTCTMVYYGIPSYIFIPPWYKYLIPWYATVYHSTTLCNYGTSMVQITYTMVCYPLYTIYYSTTLQRRATWLSAWLQHTGRDYFSGGDCYSTPNLGIPWYNLSWHLSLLFQFHSS